MRDFIIALFIGAARAAAEWKPIHPLRREESIAVLRIRRYRAQEALRSIGCWPTRERWELVPEEQLN